MTSDSFDKNLKPFSAKMIDVPQTSTVQIEGVDVLVSSPEQYSHMDLYYIMEQLTSLRADVVQILLENINNQRIKRAFSYMAEKAGHYWLDMLNMDKINLGTSKQQLVENGIYIKKYRITVPKELNEYE